MALVTLSHSPEPSAVPVVSPDGEDDGRNSHEDRRTGSNLRSDEHNEPESNNEHQKGDGRLPRLIARLDKIGELGDDIDDVFDRLRVR